MAALAFPQIFTTVGFAFPANCCFAATTPFEIVDIGCLIEEVVIGESDSIALLQMGDIMLVGEVERSVKVVLASKLGNAFAIPLSSKVWPMSQTTIVTITSENIPSFRAKTYTLCLHLITKNNQIRIRLYFSMSFNYK